MSFLKFLVFHVLITLVLIALDVYFIRMSGDTSTLNLSVAGIGFVSLLTATAYKITSSGLDKSPMHFTRNLVASIMLKLLLSIAFLMVLVFVYRPHSVAFLIAYFVAYFCLTGFEVYSLLHNLRKISKKGT